MTPERWKQIDELAQAALDRGCDHRAAFLDEACDGDEALRREVESQIAYQQQASKFLEEPAFKQHLGAQASLPALLRADPQTESESMEGRTISHYSILRKLGAGGMGEVYLAQDTSLNRNVAIKVLSQNSVAGEQAKKRLVREAKAAAGLDHPHICAVHEVSEEAGYSFIVMQYIEGQTLASRIQRQPIELREALDIAVQIADALAEAHSHNVIHRDVKPQNVMLTSSGQVKVLDFGLARVVREGPLTDSTSETESVLSAPGAVIGTVPYMSPEQVRGEALDGRSDIFSFGAVLYEMLTGRSPFEAESMGSTMSSILTKEPAPLGRYASDVPDELQRIVRKTLSKDKEGRYQGIKDLLIDLRELKQELDFEAKLERSIDPVVRDRPTTPERPESYGWVEAETAPQQTVSTGESFTTSTTSSSRIIVGEIKRHKIGVSLAVAALVTAVAGYFYVHREPVLTDKDTILLADFVNTTGDPDLDGALKTALALQLEQSPFVNLFSDERVRETLRYMGRSPDERVTKEIAREICERQGLKALLAGSVSNLGSHYVIALEATNAHTGEVLARQQEEADNKEQVLRSLGEAATRLRRKLGESLASIQKFDAPVEQATSSSLEAVKAYSLGIDLHSKGKYFEAIPLYKRAVELDPKFAIAYARLTAVYNNTRQYELSTAAAQRAFDLRDRATEREKLYASWAYYGSVTLEWDQMIEVLELWTRTYPMDWVPHNQLAIMVGRPFEKAIDEGREAIRLNPNALQPRGNLASALIGHDRFDEAKQVIQEAMAQKLESTAMHSRLYLIASVQGDTATTKQQLAWYTGRQDEYLAPGWQAQTAAFAGQLRRASEFSRRAAELAGGRDLKEVAASFAIQTALRGALAGQCQPTKAETAKALAISRSSRQAPGAFETSPPLPSGAFALALCGEVGAAQSLADEMARQYPKATLVTAIFLPVIHAAIELRRGHPDVAIESLQTVRPYEAYARFLPTYLRGNAYLRWQKGAEAAAEFQKILDHRGWDPLSQLYPLAHLGLARAASLAGDAANARKSYQEFLALWKDADADLPILIQAKKEYARLK